MDRNSEACGYFVGLCVCRPLFHHGVLVQMVRKARGRSQIYKTTLRSQHQQSWNMENKILRRPFSTYEITHFDK